MILRRLCALLVLLTTASACIPLPQGAPALGVDGAPVRPVPVAKFPAAWVGGAASDGEAVFASVGSNPRDGAGTSRIVRIDAQGVTPLVTGLAAPTAVAVDAGRVYWIDQPAYEATSSKIVRSAPKGGGAFTDLARFEGRPARVVSIGDGLAWIGAASGSIDSVAKAGGPVTTLVRGERPIVAIAQAEGGIVWATDREIRGLRGGAPVTLFAAEGVHGLATRGAEVYWTTNDSIRRGGAAAPIAATVLGAWEIVVDDAHVYWTGRDGFVCSGVLVAPREGGEPRQLDRDCSEHLARTARGVFWARRGAR